MKPMGSVGKGLFILMMAGLTASLAAQDAVSTVQPAVTLFFSGSSGVLPGGEQEYFEGVLEGELRNSFRYRLNVVRTDQTPDNVVTPDLSSAVFARISADSGATVRLQVDIWRDGRFTWSRDLPVSAGGDRYAQLNELASETALRLAETFPGFARVRFTNTGHPHPYYVYLDGAFFAAGPREVELPVGTYRVEVRRRDGDFEHVVGASLLTLQDNDFRELTFALTLAPPPVPPLLRLLDPARRWRAIVDVSAGVAIPTANLGFLEGTGFTGSARASFNDVLFHGHVMGLETIYLGYRGGGSSGGDGEPGNSDSKLDLTSLLVTTGFTEGPISGVDVVFRVGGGLALITTALRVDDPESPDLTSEGFVPAFSFSMEFGFGLFGNWRLGTTVSWFGLVEEQTVYSFLNLGLGLGGRF